MHDITTFIGQHQALAIAAVVVMILLFAVELLRGKRNSFNINPLQMTQLINHQNATVIDLRNNEAYQAGHIIDAVSLSTADLGNEKKLQRFKQKPVILVCNNGLESQKLAASLLKQGYNAFSLAGGMRAWLGAQMPIIKESK